jgi:hypothetical protein
MTIALAFSFTAFAVGILVRRKNVPLPLQATTAPGV